MNLADAWAEIAEANDVDDWDTTPRPTRRRVEGEWDEPLATTLGIDLSLFGILPWDDTEIGTLTEEKLRWRVERMTGTEGYRARRLAKEREARGREAARFYAEHPGLKTRTWIEEGERIYEQMRDSLRRHREVSA